MATWAPGTKIDGYELGDVLGEGGMGVVYRAREVETGREVAIKTLPLASDPVLAERFLREGQAQADLDLHPNIVRVHSAGEANERFYLVLDLVAGEDLQSRLERAGPLPAAEAERIMGEVASAVAHAHSRGVLHRDLKPANVILSAEGPAKLLDFGVAHLEGRRTLTATGEIVGTPAYMAPEQLNNSKEADERADVYGLGATLYACLTGRPPFEAGSQIALMKKVFDEPAPSVADIRADAPPHLVRTCKLALAKKPARRLQSVAEFQALLRREALPYTPPSKARVWLGALGYLAFAGFFVLGLLSVAADLTLSHYLAGWVAWALLGLAVVRWLRSFRSPNSHAAWVIPYLIASLGLLEGFDLVLGRGGARCKCGIWAHASVNFQTVALVVISIGGAWALLWLSADRLFVRRRPRAKPEVSA